MRAAARRAAATSSSSARCATTCRTEAGAEWIAAVPGTDTALMLALAHTLVAEGLHDRAFLDRYCVGWPVFERYLLGRDGRPAEGRRLGRADHRRAGGARSAPWRAGCTARRALIDRGACRCSAPSTASSRSGWRRCWRRCSARSACRAAATATRSARIGVLRQARQRGAGADPAAGPQPASRDFIPVARIADMLLNPGAPFDYNGQTPDLSRHPAGLLGRRQPVPPPPGPQPPAPRPSRRLDTLVVHELAWTATARHADIVLPCTMTLEREDIGAAPTTR